MSRILITGAGGYIGGLLGARLADGHSVVGLDVRVPPDLPFECRQGDIRDPSLADLLREKHIDTVVHLAAVLED
ncbi:MAG TPA: NAD-dependent epimerase/dehydratase family protein, partial [Alcanivorax sp.]|nr:NAD-dependent epimerase/dehydratase family protein [Alcanivorax sp.]